MAKGKEMAEHQEKSKVLVIGISSPSGGGKTTIAKRVSELLANSVTISFDGYDFETVHPASYRRWLEEGADYNAWKTPKLSDDLRKIKEGKSIISPVDGRSVNPQRYVIFDAPLGYAHAETAKFIDFMVFIDAPLDVAMARRLLRDFPPNSSDDPIKTMQDIRMQMSAYLDYGRQAFLQGDKQIKPYCDLILDGCLPVEDIANEIVEAIRGTARFVLNGMFNPA